VIWVLLAALAAALIWLLAPVLSPFFLAWVLAYATEPVVSFMSAPRASARPGARHWRLPRALAVLLVELASICVVAVLVLVVTTILRVQVPQLQEQLPVLLGKVAAGLSPMLARWGIDVPSDAQSLKTMILHGLSSNGAGLGATLLSSVRLGGGLAVTLIGHLVLVPLVWFYLLLDWPELGPKLHALVPARHRAVVDDFVHDCNRMLGQYLRGQLMVMALLALYYSIGLMLFGFELAWPIGMFTGFVYFIPYLGFGMGLVLALIAGFLQFLPTHGLGYPLMAVAVVFGAGQVIEGFFLTPRLVGHRIGLHPVAVIFVLLACGQLFGILGVLLALPLSAVGVVVLRRALQSYRHSRFYLDAGADPGAHRP
jgi:predicted PurR-regulated permease PerM